MKDFLKLKRDSRKENEEPENKELYPNTEYKWRYEDKTLGSRVSGSNSS